MEFLAGSEYWEYQILLIYKLNGTPFSTTKKELHPMEAKLLLLNMWADLACTFNFCLDGNKVYSIFII